MKTLFKYLTLVLVLVIGKIAYAMHNPASRYCVQNGGRLEIVKDSNNGEIGLCRFLNGVICEEWSFYRKQCDPYKNLESEACLSSGLIPNAYKDTDCCDNLQKVYLVSKARFACVACGDGVCDSLENKEVCSRDCGKVDLDYGELDCDKCQVCYNKMFFKGKQEFCENCKKCLIADSKS